MRDALHPGSLPGGVRKAWASLSRADQTLGVFSEEADDPEEDAKPGAAVGWATSQSPPP